MRYRVMGSWILAAIGGASLAMPIRAAEPTGHVAKKAPAASNSSVVTPDRVFTNSSGQSVVEQVNGECCESAEACGSCDSSCGGGLLGFCEGDLGDPWTLSSLCADECGNPPAVVIGGWTQFGYTNKSDGVFNTHPNNLNLHQGWLYAEKATDGSDGLDFGGRIDLVYGVDAQNTQAFGNNPGVYDFQNGWDHGIYGWALPQLYAEVAYNDLKVKAGHFYTLLGYEVVTAPGNFFYSHAFTMNFSEAFTHTGVLASYTAGDVTYHGGWTLGWDTGFDQFNGGSSFLGGASVKAAEDVTVTYITTFGNLGWTGDGYSHSIVADWAISDNWQYVFQSDFINTNFNPLTAGPYNTVGWNNYLFYTVSDRVKVGGRAEWWKADGSSYYEVTGGVNIKPCANLVIRPELRYQWAPGQDDANVFGIPVNTGIFGIDAIVTF